MKFMHLADLHLGKIVHGYNMIENQEYALNQIIKLLEKENIKHVIIAGDVYQSSVAQTEAINLFGKFLYALNQMDICVMVISGNHDSSDRLSYASEIMASSNIYISKTYNGEIEKVTLSDKFGPVNFYLFPYVKPNYVRPFFKDKDINSYEDAVKAAIESIDLNTNERNIMISHQFIRNAELSSSEEIYAGDVEAVSASLYNEFDYVALGHIHKKQSFNKGRIRYPGALLKYDSKESNYKKSITVVELLEKGNIIIEDYEIDVLRDMRIIRGYFNDIVEKSFKDKNKEDYIHIELLDEMDILNGLQILRDIYPNIMTYRLVNTAVGENNIEDLIEEMENKSPLNLFEEFYEQRLGKELSEEQRAIIKPEIDSIWGKDESN